MNQVTSTAISAKDQSDIDAQLKAQEHLRFKLHTLSTGEEYEFGHFQDEAADEPRDEMLAILAHPIGAVDYQHMLESAIGRLKVMTADAALANKFEPEMALAPILSRLADMKLIVHGGCHFAYRHKVTKDVAALYDIAVVITQTLRPANHDNHPPYEFVQGGETYYAYCFPQLALPNGVSVIWEWADIKPVGRSEFCHQAWLVEGELTVAELPAPGKRAEVMSSRANANAGNK